MNKNILYICSLLVGIMTSCQNSTQNNALEMKTEYTITPELKKLIALDTLSTRMVNKELELTGSVSYNQDQIYSYQSLVSGLVEAVNFKIGDYVKKGQSLMEVRTTELSVQKSELLKAQADLKLAVRKLTSSLALHKDGVTSDRELQEAKNEVTNANGEINRINETLIIQGGNIEKGSLSVKSALTGYVVEKKITPGTQIDAGETGLFVISDLKKIWVMVNVYATQLESVKVGQQVVISTSAYPNRTFNGKISRMANAFDPEERVLKAIIELDNKDLLLKPSMMVSVKMQQPTKQRAIGIPKDALLFFENEHYALLYHSDQNVKVIKVNKVGSDSKFYYVDNEDITDRDLVITKNNLLIFNKLKDR